MICKKQISFKNGNVFLLRTDDGYPLEVTETFLPRYTKYSVNHNNCLLTNDIGNRYDRWMIGVSCMSGCPIRCKFCATGNLQRWRNLSYLEIVEQVEFVLNKINEYDPNKSFEFKINYTRMGEPFLNIDNVRKAVEILSMKYPNTHHYISTIGIKNSDFSWISGNITLQLSLHSLDEKRRNNLIPSINKLSIEELGKIRTKSNLKTTLNLTLVDNADFDIDILKKYFDPTYFFIKLSPINTNAVSEKNNMGKGIIDIQNIL